MSLDDDKLEDSLQPEALPSEPARPGMLGMLIRRLILPALIVAGGGGVAWWVYVSRPVARRVQPARSARMVDVSPLQSTSRTIRIDAMGKVVAANDINLQPQVSGEVIKVSSDFEPGGILRAGQLILQIEPKDYELAVDEKISAVTQAEADLRLEEGQQKVALREYEVLGENIEIDNQDLILRRPQLAMRQADLASARAALENAQLDLQRTTIVAPFNALVLERNADLGTRVSTSSSLAQLAGTDVWWIEAVVPVDQLRWIEFPRTGQQGSSVGVYDQSAWGAQRYRKGRVSRLVGTLEEQGRLARILVEVADPMALQPENEGQPVMLLGAYVRVEIHGTQVDDVIVIERQYVRTGDTAWVFLPDGQLDIRNLEILFRMREEVIVTDGLKPGEMLVTTDLSAPVQGMPLRLADGAVDDASGDAEVGSATGTTAQ